MTQSSRLISRKLYFFLCPLRSFSKVSTDPVTDLMFLGLFRFGIKLEIEAS